MKFSIITPSYNQGEFIGQTIESVVSQEGDFEIEYFVMDGGSTDKTVAILKDYEKKLRTNKRVKFFWLSQNDNGQADAINRGIRKASGDVVAYINSDDWYLPGAFQKVEDFFAANPHKQWVVGNCEVTDPKLKWTFWLKHVWPIDRCKAALPVFNTVNQPAVFLKKELIAKIGFFEQTLKYSFDYDYWLRCHRHQLPARITTPLACFRIHSGSKGNTSYVKQFDEDLSTVKRYTSSRIVLMIHLLAARFVQTVYADLKK